MATRLLIKVYNPEIKLLVFPMTEDIMIETESQFSNLSEVIPFIGDAINTYTLLTAGMSGGVSEDLLKTKNMFDIKRWTKTDPLRFTAKLILYTKDDPMENVYNRAKYLIDQVILSKDTTGRFTIPGVSMSSLSDFQGETSPTDSIRAKIISAWIPGVIYLPIAMIEKVQTTFSKETTDSGYPLWAMLSVNIESIMPANSDFFDNIKINYGGKELFETTPV